MNHRMNMVALLSMMFVGVLTLCWSAEAQNTTSVSSDYTGKTLLMAIPGYPEGSYGDKMVKLAFTEVARRLGFHVIYKTYPPARASLMADKGELDGELVRIYEYGEAHPNLVRVEEVAATEKMVAVGINPAIQINGVESLRDTNYRVEYRRGYLWDQKALSQLVKPENLSVIDEEDMSFQKLLRGRIDIFVGPGSQVLPLLQSKEWKDSGIRPLGVLAEIPDYIYLHKRHAALAPQISLVLKAMKEEGLVEQYHAIILQELSQEE